MVNTQRAPAGDVKVGGVKHHRQVFGFKAKCGNYHIGVEREVAFWVIFRRAASRGIGGCKPHFGNMHALDFAVAVKTLGAGQPDKLDALFFGIGHFALRPRHIIAVAAVQAFYGLCALADGGADTIHCGVAATYDDDVFAMRIHRAAVESGDGIAKALAIGNGKKIEGRDDSVKPATWRCNRPRLVHAGGNK